MNKNSKSRIKMKKMEKLIYRDWIIAFIYALVIVFFISIFIWPMKVKGRSMENTLQDNDYILVSKAITLITKYKYNDLIILNYNDDSITNKIVKRIIGLEGDHIRITDNKVIRNGKILEENYIKGTTTGDIDIFVPEGSVFFLGDNRSISKDSRILGCYDKSKIKGKVIRKL
ncbi:signal peptidase I [Vallitalea longa]|uniref:Signal peptidase I n=1 Tax=Vallitalea longa TaxID=2936439 RepID=A0A9W5Y9K1_9FIRM|nr:signal peptidase I [Vallitalea longa]GKX28550.1 signal peptidase I [Vallitalea longa]